MWLTVAVINSGEELNIRKGKLHFLLSAKEGMMMDFTTQFTCKRKTVRSGKTGYFRLTGLEGTTIVISGSKGADLQSGKLPSDWMKVEFGDDHITVFRHPAEKLSDEEKYKEGDEEESEESEGNIEKMEEKSEENMEKGKMEEDETDKSEEDSVEDIKGEGLIKTGEKTHQITTTIKTAFA